MQKVKRISLKAASPGLGKRMAALKEAFFKMVPTEGKIRIYNVPGGNTCVVHRIDAQGGQHLYKAVEQNGQFRFEIAGHATSGFGHREVFNGLKGKGLGAKLLRTHEADERAHGSSILEHSTALKSTALLFYEKRVHSKF